MNNQIETIKAELIGIIEQLPEEQCQEILEELFSPSCPSASQQQET